MDGYGLASLLPVAVVITLVLITRRTALSLLAGTVAGAVMLYGAGFAKPWLDVVYGVMGSELWIWLVLVCGFFGSLVALFEASGGIQGFTYLAEKLCKGPKRTLFATWLLGIVVFVDDWLSILSVGNAMRRATDRYRIPREMLAYVSNVTASSICVIVPTSTWGVFMISQLAATGVCNPEEGIGTFVGLLPLLFYPLLALLCVLLFSLGIIPVFGPMKQAYRRTENCELQADSTEHEQKNARAANFLLPVVLVTAITIATGEILYGALACLVFCAVLYLPQRKMTPGQFLDKVRSGFQDMIGVLFIVTSAFILRDINNLLGMPDYVIGAAKASIAPWLLPATVFLLVTALAVAAGNFWGICAISFPVIIPIAQVIGADVGLTAAAIISATAAGSHLCFFGAEATLACSAAQIEAVNYARTSLPLLVLPVVGTTVLYLVSGWMI